MRIASLNLAKQFGEPMLSEIGSQPDLRKTDILLLQETVDGPRGHVASDIAAKLGLQFAFRPAFRLNSDFEEGLAILSRYPIDQIDVKRLASNRLHFHTRIRIALAVTLQTPKGPLRVVNVHLDNRINARPKQEQISEIWPLIEGFTGACAIGGDFNSGNFFWISHLIPIPGVQSLNGRLRNEMNRHEFVTPLGRGPGTLHFMDLRLDWIYLRGLKAEGSGVTPIRFSDHNSVWVEVL